ncbi:MAG: iron ABC transporter permease [Deltaproteobacteria bacterium]|jgi:iron complex transport system permease protein|nr:iron ABC transporter permease [Deltaproteobacteria bacterium]
MTAPEAYRSGFRPGKLFGLAFFLVFALLFLSWESVSRGYMDVSAREIWEVLKAVLNGEALTSPGSLVVWEVRLPRLAASLAVGAALGLSGAIFQGLLLNPLADPYTLGVSSGAALGAAAVISVSIVRPIELVTLKYFGVIYLPAPFIPAAGAFFGAGLSLVAVMALAREKNGSLPPTNLILAGVIMSAILSAALSFLKYLAGDQVSSIIFWLLGSFVARTWADFWVVIIFFLPAFFVAMFSALDLNIMTLGLKEARTLGVSTEKVRFRLLVAASLSASAAVAVSGIIGFAGLIVPHLIRSIIGPDHRTLLPFSALAGAVLLAAADWTVRVLLPGEIPVGVFTALLAGPVFLIIFRRKMREPGRV